MATAVMEDSPSQDFSWESSDFADAVEETSTDATEIINPPANGCPVCGEEVVRAPGARGRAPKYHPECRPRGKRNSNSAQTIRVAKRDQEAAEQVEQIIERCRRGLAKAVLLVSLADPYDALVIQVNTPALLDNLRVALNRWPWLREQSANANAGASILGLLLVVGTTLLPILAHHGLIPSKKFAPLLVQIPVLLKKIQDQMEFGGEDMGELLLQRVREQQMRAAEEHMRRATAENVDASSR